MHLVTTSLSQRYSQNIIAYDARIHVIIMWAEFYHMGVHPHAIGTNRNLLPRPVFNLWSNSSTKHSHQCRFSVWFHMPCVCNVIHIVTPHVWRNTHDNYRYIERYCCGRTNLTPIKKPTCYPSHHISNIVIYFAYHWNHLRVSDGSWWPGDRLSIKMSSYQYKDPHVKDKTVSKHSYL